ncbi:MAG: efflux RND transporter periplasmic adaptor subunit [Curvibacter sp.]|nr:MAG: efflux RND transporter periplasmic adaptor subunit [Curvibacter sp.]
MKLSSSFRRRLLLSGLAVLLIGLFFFVMLRVGPLAPIKVTVAQVKEGSIAPELFGIGTVEARRNWMIGPTVAGRVLSVNVDVGETVKAGQLLAEMDPVDIDQRLASLDAAIERAKSAQLATSAQQVDAMAKQELASSNMRRNQDLADRRFISSGALENFAQAKASADAALDIAHANATGATQDLARTKADRAALAQQRANVRLVAPSDGVVSARDAEPGSTVVAGQSVLRMIDPASLWVKLRVDQGRSSGLSQGLKARIVLRSQPQIAQAATVARVELLGDSVTEERIAQLSFDKVPVGLFVGEMAEATIQLPPTPKTLIVPAASIQRQGGSTGVWRMESGKPAFAQVKVGAASLDGQVQVLEGLQVGDEIVVYSEKPLTTGARLQVVDAIVRPAVSSGTAP